MWTFAAIALFGMLGCWARYLQASLVQTIWGADFPYVTLSINLMGSFLMGFLFIETLERLTLAAADHERRGDHRTHLSSRSGPRKV
jgi:fluoride exporter